VKMKAVEQARIPHAAAVALAAAAFGEAAGNLPTLWGTAKAELKAAVARDPFDAMVVTVLGGAFLFYLAEKGRNPKVQSVWDALVFVSTCASVGYADVFARTPAGKAIAAAVMTIGPALSGAMLEPGATATPPPEHVALAAAILTKLDAILGELRAAQARTQAP